MPKPKGFKKVDNNIFELGRYSLYKSSLFLLFGIKSSS